MSEAHVKKLRQPEPLPEGASPDRAWLQLERKYRVAEYESLAICLGVSANVNPGESPAQAARRLFEELKVEFDEVLAVMRTENGI